MSTVSLALRSHFFAFSPHLASVISVKRSIYAHFCEQHWPAIFGGIEQHLNS
jgi:hypothetical protein